MGKMTLNDYLNMRIGEDKKFLFHCTQCGACCRNRNDIILNPKDLFQIAEKMNSTPTEIALRYCDIYIGDSSRIPIIRLKSIGSDNRCPFLKNNKCSIHDVKPVICAMFPIGRIMTYETGKEHPNKYEYIFVNPGCGDNTEEHTVKEWLQNSGIPLQDDFFIQWSEITFELCQAIKCLRDRIPETIKLELWNGLLNILYFEYDLRLEFLPQFQRNADILLRSLQQLLAT